MNIKILTLTLFLSFSLTSLAQKSKSKVKEVGITFYNLKNYGAIFKIGQEDRLWRFRVLTSSANKTDYERVLTSSANKTDYRNEHLTNFNLNLSAGRERRKSVSDKLNFIYGIELSGGIQSNKTKIDNWDATITQNSFTVGLTGVLGFNYFITNSLFVGGELLPIAQFRQTTVRQTIEKNSLFTEDLSVTDNYNFGFNNNSVLLSVGFKF